MNYFNTVIHEDKKRELIKERKKNRLLFIVKNNKYKKFLREI